MCTLIVVTQVWPTRPLVIAANRDERLSRPAEGPALRPAGGLADRRVLAPRDLVAGGTWIGLNDAGLVVAITNRRSSLTHQAAPRSRGALVSLALGADDRRQAGARVAGDPDHPNPPEVRDYGPFHLLLADRSGAEVLWSDGRALHRQVLEPGVHWITERSFGAGASARHDRLATWARALAAEPLPAPARWAALLADHDHGEVGLGLDAMCVHAPMLNYGTRSSSLIALGDQPTTVEWHHADGHPCEHPLVDRSAAAQQLFAGD